MISFILVCSLLELILLDLQPIATVDFIMERIGEPLTLGEGPHWDDKTNKLYYVDILKSEVYSYDPQSQIVSKAVVGNAEKPVSLIIPVKNESDIFLITYGTDIAKIKWDGKSDTISDFKILASATDRYPELRFNDGKCDPNGVLLAGTMESNIDLDENPPGKGSLYTFKNNQIRKLFGDVKISNGLAWSADGKTLYFIDSLLHRIDGFDYDAKNIGLSNRRTVFDFKENQILGFPDGMTIDENGCLWVAVFGGGRVIHIDPKTGTLLNTIEFPASLITSVAFGGGNCFNKLYVTSAIKGTPDGPSSEDADAGYLFEVTLFGSVTGPPGVPVKL